MSKESEEGKDSRKGEKVQRVERRVRSKTHLSWSVSVSAVERGDGEAVRVCESLDGISEETKPKGNKTDKRNKQTKKPRRHTESATFERSRTWGAEGAVEG